MLRRLSSLVIICWALVLVAPTAGAQPSFDCGDAPDSYGTLQTGGGARHLATGPYLGDTRDADADGQPTVAADGDDTDAEGDDEDGVLFLDPFIPGHPTLVRVVITDSAARLHAYFDWGHDGEFDHLTNEHPIDNLLLAAGIHFFNISVPANTSFGHSYARFRLTTADAPGSPARGDFPDGEVEDHFIFVGDPIPTSETSWSTLKEMFR